MLKVIDISKKIKKVCKDYMYGNKLTYSLTISLSTDVCFRHLSLKAAEILNFKNELKFKRLKSYVCLYIFK
jgi:hypothetical protein